MNTNTLKTTMFTASGFLCLITSCFLLIYPEFYKEFTLYIIFSYPILNFRDELMDFEIKAYGILTAPSPVTYTFVCVLLPIVLFIFTMNIMGFVFLLLLLLCHYLYKKQIAHDYSIFLGVGFSSVYYLLNFIE